MTVLSSSSLKDQFLIATPQLTLGIFKSSVTYICEHNSEGAMGIIINRPSTMVMKNILNELHKERIPLSDMFEDHPVMVGGPVGLERGFVLHESQPNENHWDSTIQVSENIALTGSKDILEALSLGQGPEKFLMSLGYAGWDGGQLEQEMLDNAWITTPGDSDIIFNTPYHLRANAAAKLLGIDLTTMAPQAGNA